MVRVISLLYNGSGSGGSVKMRLSVGIVFEEGLGFRGSRCFEGFGRF